MLHHGVGLHFIENNAFHSLFFQKSLYAVQIPEAFDDDPPMTIRALVPGRGRNQDCPKNPRQKRFARA